MNEEPFYCPNCNAILITIYDKPSFAVKCPKCGYGYATTMWDEIDLDETVYTLSVIPISNIDNINILNIDKETYKVLSKITGLNYINIKKLLINGGIIFKGNAVKIKDIINKLNKINIKYNIKPYYKYL